MTAEEAVAEAKKMAAIRKTLNGARDMEKAARDLDAEISKIESPGFVPHRPLAVGEFVASLRQTADCARVLGKIQAIIASDEPAVGIGLTAGAEKTKLLPGWYFASELTPNGYRGPFPTQWAALKGCSTLFEGKFSSWSEVNALDVHTNVPPDVLTFEVTAEDVEQV